MGPDRKLKLWSGYSCCATAFHGSLICLLKSIGNKLHQTSKLRQQSTNEPCMFFRNFAFFLLAHWIILRTRSKLGDFNTSGQIRCDAAPIPWDFFRKDPGWWDEPFSILGGAWLLIHTNCCVGMILFHYLLIHFGHRLAANGVKNPKMNGDIVYNIIT